MYLRDCTSKKLSSMQRVKTLIKNIMNWIMMIYMYFLICNGLLLKIAFHIMLWVLKYQVVGTQITVSKFMRRSLLSTQNTWLYRQRRKFNDTNFTLEMFVYLDPCSVHYAWNKLKYLFEPVHRFWFLSHIHR